MDRLARKSASGRTLLALEYDRNGNKVRQIDVTGKLTGFDYDPMGQLLRLTDDGQELAAYTYNPDGTPRAVTHGPIRQEYAYDAWGNLTVQEEAVPNRFKFTGQQLDTVTQQYYLRARFYNPVIARFTQEDTYRGDGLNLYAYCANNPVYYVDPSGNTLSNCQKDAYNKLRNEGFTAAEAYQAVTNRIGVKTNAMTDRQLQMAVDYLYMTGNPDGYDYPVVYALTLAENGKIVFSANGRAPSHTAKKEATRMFGSNLEVA